MIGQKFHRLTILREEVKKVGRYSRSYWYCACDCGKTQSIRKDAILDGSSKSCGCLQRDVASQVHTKPENRKYPPGFNDLYTSYRNRAKYKNIEFSIDKDNFYRLAQMNCFYCNKKPSSLFRRMRYKTNKNDFYYNGLDKIDSKRGYCLDNVATCCENCNYAKSDLTTDQFFDMIIRIYEYRELNNKGNK